MASKKPTAKVTGLAAPTRVKDSWGWQVKWGVPASAKKGNAAASGVEVEWELGCGLNYKDKKGKWVLRNPRRVSKVGINFNDWLKCWINGGWDWSNGFKHVTRNSFYPLTKYKIYNIHAHVRLTNNKGKGPEVHVYRAISTPRNPTLATPEHDEQTGRVSCEITVNKSTEEDGRECYDVQWRVKVVDTRIDSTERIVKSGGTTGTTVTPWYDVADRQQLTYGQYVKVTFEAWTRGFAGDSAHVTKVKYVSYPGQATVTEVDIPSTEDTAKVTVQCQSGNQTEHPVTMVKLQQLRNVEYESAADIPPTERWEDTGAVDNGTVTALAQLVGDMRPDRGKRTWVRIKTIHEFEDLFYRYSEPVQLEALYTEPATAADEKISILSVTPNAAGDAAMVVLGWNADGTDDSDGTELTWSEYSDAWRSNEEPESWEFTWSDGELTHGEVTYHDSASVIVRGLEVGKQYFFRARRYMDGDEKTYSAYSSTADSITGIAPGDVSLSAPQMVARGHSIPLTWIVGDGDEQTAWEVLTGDVVATADGKSVQWDGETIIVASGEGPMCSCVLDAERVSSIVGSGAALPVSVRSARGGEYSESQILAVAIVDAPVLTMTVPETVTAQGPTIPITCDLVSDVRITCSSLGASGDSPDGMREQVAGDVVWSAALSPAWQGTGPYTFDVVMPTGLDLWNNVSYVVSATARDPLTGLESSRVEGTFVVELARPAPSPAEGITVVATDTTDEDGIRTRQATITLVAPADAAEGDTYDVYRMTPDGAYAIAVEQALNAVVTDPYAPYGGEDKSYRVALRTADGDVNWLDFPYELTGKDLRIDWGDSYVELPWNVSLNDSWEKDFEARTHLGSDTPSGYWNEGVTRKASLSTDLIRVTDGDRATALRALAQHSGPAFVRTPLGSAYEANVSVGGLGYEYNANAMPVSLDATEVNLTAEYMAIVTIPTGDGEDEGVEP